VVDDVHHHHRLGLWNPRERQTETGTQRRRNRGKKREKSPKSSIQHHAFDCCTPPSTPNTRYSPRFYPEYSVEGLHPLPTPHYPPSYHGPHPRRINRALFPSNR
jgi:hypothetical protein